MDPEQTWPDWWPVEYREAHPYWHVWKGVAGLLYGRRLMSSPPRVVRAVDVDDLKGAIVKEDSDIEAGVRTRRTWNQMV